jgi:hypothetical protein
MNIELINRPIPSSAGNAKRTPSPLPELCNCTPDEGLARLDANRSGLTAEQVEARLEQYGPNAVTHEKPPTWYRQLFHAFNGVLFAVSVVSLFSDVIFAAPEDRSFRTIIVLITMVLLSTLLRFWQEFRSNKAGGGIESDGDIDHRSVACWNGSATGDADRKPSSGRYHLFVSRRHGSCRRSAAVGKRLVRQPSDADRRVHPTRKTCGTAGNGD